MSQKVAYQKTFEGVLDDVYERLMILHENKQGAYLMRDRKVHSVPQWVALAQSANTMGAFKMNLPELLVKSEKMRHYAKRCTSLARVGLQLGAII